MDERVFEVLFAECAGWQVVSAGRVLATVHSQDRGKDRAILAAKCFAGKGGVGIVRVLSKIRSLLEEHTYGKASFGAAYWQRSDASRLWSGAGRWH